MPWSKAWTAFAAADDDKAAQRRSACRMTERYQANLTLQPSQSLACTRNAHVMNCGVMFYRLTQLAHMQAGIRRYQPLQAAARARNTLRGVGRSSQSAAQRIALGGRRAVVLRQLLVAAGAGGRAAVVCAGQQPAVDALQVEAVPALEHPQHIVCGSRGSRWVRFSGGCKGHRSLGASSDRMLRTRSTPCSSSKAMQQPSRGGPAFISMRMAASLLNAVASCARPSHPPRPAMTGQPRRSSEQRFCAPDV